MSGFHCIIVLIASVLIYTAKSPVETSIAPYEKNTISEHQESSSFTMKRSVIVQSSSSQVTTSSASTVNSEPNVQVHSYSSHSEEQFEQTGDKPPVQVSELFTKYISTYIHTYIHIHTHFNLYLNLVPHTPVNNTVL
jgi:hypothetical protein